MKDQNALVILACVVAPLAIGFDACLAARALHFPLFYVIVPALSYFVAGLAAGTVFQREERAAAARNRKYFAHLVDKPARER